MRRKFVSRAQNLAHQMGQIAAMKSAFARTLRNATIATLQRMPSMIKRSALAGAGFNPSEERYLQPPSESLGGTRLSGEMKL